METLEEAHVADYFLIAGLPENPVLLENSPRYGLEFPLSKSVDPITDIAIIFKSLGEEVPQGYHVIARTPSGFSANLNYGSFRSPSVFLCFQRGRNKLPIIDIGVMYEGKENVMDGCDVIYQTPYGRPANVNNSGARTFITYRRSKGLTPNELTVSDICIILTNKGEKPPHAFMKINKNLNTGMVGSDVFICYKKTLSLINVISYVPALLARYPVNDIEKIPLQREIPDFCLPMGANLEKWPQKYVLPEPVFTSFVLTHVDGENVYGVSCIFYEPYPIEKLTEDQRSRLRFTPPVPPPPIHLPSPNFKIRANTSLEGDTKTSSVKTLRKRTYSENIGINSRSLLNHKSPKSYLITSNILNKDVDGRPIKKALENGDVINNTAIFQKCLTEKSGQTTNRHYSLSPITTKNISPQPNKSSRSSPRKTSSSSSSNSPAKYRLPLQMPHNPNNIYTNKAICILSRSPLFDLFKKFLRFLYHVVTNEKGSEIPVERYVSFLMYDIPYPSSSRPQILVQLPLNTTLHMIQTFNIPSGVAGASFKNLLESLNSEHLLNLIVAVLLEKYIILHTLRISTLAGICEALKMMTFPLQWNFPYAPFCPINETGVLSSPVPFIIGLDSTYFDMFQVPSQDIITVDLDTYTVIIPDSKLATVNYKNLPKKIVKVLKNSHDRLYHDLKVLNSYSLKARTNEDEFQLCKAKELMERRIQDTFLRFMGALLKDYQRYLIPVTKRTNKMTDIDTRHIFDFEGFVRSRDKNCTPFYNELVKTSMFNQFIKDRSFVTSKESNFSFFDEIMEKVDPNADRDDQSFLKDINDEIFNSDYTVFITPPDSNNLLIPPKIYKYDSFPIINPELIAQMSNIKPNACLVVDQDKPDQESINNTDAENIALQSKNNVSEDGGELKNKPTTPAHKRLQSYSEDPHSPHKTESSPIITRTKQEIKSGKRIAQINFENPYFRARYLLNSVISIWFVYLPAYAKRCTNKRKALYCALEILTQIPKTGIKHPNELCYRILLLLCGIYKEPLLAVRVLREMKKLGLQPNAVTYGYYNKALVGSNNATQDQRKENISAQLSWSKVRNVISAMAQFKRNCPGYVYRRKFVTCLHHKKLTVIRKRPHDDLPRQKYVKPDQDEPDAIYCKEDTFTCEPVYEDCALVLKFLDLEGLQYESLRHRQRMRQLYSGLFKDDIANTYFDRTINKSQLVLFYSNPYLSNLKVYLDGYPTALHEPANPLESTDNVFSLSRTDRDHRNSLERRERCKNANIYASDKLNEATANNYQNTNTKELVKNTAHAILNSPFARAVGQKFDKIITKLDNALMMANTSSSSMSSCSCDLNAGIIPGNPNNPININFNGNGNIIQAANNQLEIANLCNSQKQTNLGTGTEDYLSITSSLLSEESSSRYGGTSSMRSDYSNVTTADRLVSLVDDSIKQISEPSTSNNTNMVTGGSSNRFDKTPQARDKFSTTQHHQRKVSAHTLPFPNPPSRTALQQGNLYVEDLRHSLLPKAYYPDSVSQHQQQQQQQIYGHRHRGSYGGRELCHAIPQYFTFNNNNNIQQQSIIKGQSPSIQALTHIDHSLPITNNHRPQQQQHLLVERGGGGGGGGGGRGNTFDTKSNSSAKSLFKAAATGFGNKIKDFLATATATEGSCNFDDPYTMQYRNLYYHHHPVSNQSSYPNPMRDADGKSHNFKPSFLTDRAMLAEYSQFYKEHIEHSDFNKFGEQVISDEYGNHINEHSKHNSAPLKMVRKPMFWDLKNFESSNLYVLDKNNPYLVSIIREFLRNIQSGTNSESSSADNIAISSPKQELDNLGLTNQPNENDFKNTIESETSVVGDNYKALESKGYRRAMSNHILGTVEQTISSNVLNEGGATLSPDQNGENTFRSYSSPNLIEGEGEGKLDDIDAACLHPRNITTFVAGDNKNNQVNPPVKIVERVNISTCTSCPHCKTLMFDEEIIMGWFPDDSNLNTKCRYCSKTFVPKLKATTTRLDYSMISGQVSKLHEIISNKISHPVTKENTGKKGDTSFTSSSPLASLNTTLTNFVNPISQELDINNHGASTLTNETLNLPLFERGKSLSSYIKGNSNLTEKVLTNHRISTSSTDTNDIDVNLNPELEAILSTFLEDTPQNINNFLALIDMIHEKLNKEEDPMASVVDASPLNPTSPTPMVTFIEPYLSPLVLQKELENVLDHESNEECLLEPTFVRDHSCVFWNMLWYFYRFGLPSFLPDLLIEFNKGGTQSHPQPKQQNDGQDHVQSLNLPQLQQRQHIPVEIIAFWDNIDIYLSENISIPLYLHQYFYQNNLHEALDKMNWPTVKSSIEESDISISLEAISKNDLYMAMLPIFSKYKKLNCKVQDTNNNNNFQNLINNSNGDKGEDLQNYKNPTRLGLYREMLWLTLLLHDFINYDAFDYEYKRAFQRLKLEFGDVMQPDDVPNYNDINVYQTYFCNNLYL